MDKLQKIINKFHDKDSLENIDIRETLLILEIGYENLKGTEFGAHVLTSFPENSALIFALKESISSYWPQIALSWIEERNVKLTPELINALDKAITSKWARQDFKQRAKKIINLRSESR